MDQPLDEAYFKWLYHQVASIRVKNPARTYWSLLRLLFTKEYVWLVPNDDNRVEDGRDLRYEFIHEYDLDSDPDWLGVGCSMLEMIVGLSRRLAFEADEGESRDWFWELIENLDLRKCNDGYFYNYKDGEVDKLIETVLDQVIWRTYHSNGRGGLFPSRTSSKGSA